MSARAPAPRSGRAAGRAPARPAAPWLAAVAVVLVALDLRGPLVALPAVSERIEASLGVSSGAIGLLTSVPVLSFGLAAPLASALIARAGLHRSVVLALVGLVAGTLVRSAAGYPAALAGTVVAGVAITVGNIALPVVIGQDFPRRVGTVTALYTAALNVGSTLTSALTPVVAGAVGWRAALDAWIVLALAAVAVWWPLARSKRDERLVAGDAAAAGSVDPAALVAVPAVPVWRRPSTWGLTATFAGQAFAYYGATAWLPRLLHDEQGMDASSAGASAAIFQLTAVAGAFGVPALLRATGRPRTVLQLVCACWAALPVGLLLAPGAWWLWCALAGAAQGGGITVVFVAVVERSASVRESRRLSATVQGAGYVVGALGPTVVGAVHAASGTWGAALGVVAAAIAVMLLAGSLAMPARRVRPPGASPTVGA